MSRPVRFTLTAEHVTLLRASYVQQGLSDLETGAAWIDPKRPYGNSDVAGDVIELLGWPYPDGFDVSDELPSEMYERALTIHAETPTALQIVLSTGAFQPGVYERAELSLREWRSVAGSSAVGAK